MKRRSLLESGIALGAAFVAGSRPQIASAAAAAPARALVPITVSLDRVTRTTVGLRPYRARGFVLRAEGRDDKTLVHDYGHGGGGMSLSWGCALLAAELAAQTEKRSAAVVGCGVVGLSTARVLQDGGFDVTIYAESVPPNTTSDMSGAQWSPKSVYDDTLVDDAFRTQYVRAATLAYDRYQAYLGDDYGVRWIENYDCHDDPESPFMTGADTRPLTALYPELVVYGPGRHPFPTRYATRFLTMLIEPNRYLRALVRDVLVRGGRIVVRRFDDMAQLVALPEPLVMNCTGLGSGTLARDASIEPVRGQLSVLAPQSDIDYIALHGTRYMFPRPDGIVLGGTFEHGATSLEPDATDERAVVADHVAFFSAMRRAST